MLNDKRFCRNAGSIFSLNGSLYRAAQDGSRLYGEKVRITRIESLSRADYYEKEIQNSPILCGSGKGWNKLKMHTFNVFRWNEQLSVIVDGTPLDYDHKVRVFRRSDKD